MSDNPIKFTAGLTTAVLLIAEIENVEDTENLRIQVCNSELSYDIASGSEIMPCNKIDKPQVVYRFTGNVMTSITTLRT